MVKSTFEFEFFMLSPLIFLQQTYEELLKVIWPTRNETIRLTVVVILSSLIVGLFLGTLDFVFTKLLSLLINK